MSYVRMSVKGTTTGGEVWSVNPCFDPSGEFPGGVDQTKLDAACLAIASNTVPVTLLGACSTMMSVTGIRLEVRDDANDELIALSEQGVTTAQPGFNPPKMPPQSAMVFSLRTNTTGGSGRGRLYWPCLGFVLESNARLSQINAEGSLTAMKQYLTDARSDLATAFTGIGFDLAVRSRLTKTTPHVVRIQLGNIVDTQRRRTDKLAESFSTIAFP